MSSPNDVSMKDNDDNDLRKPFTVEENIQQLNAIDKSIVQLIHHTGIALNALAVPANSSASATASSKAPSSLADAKSQLDPPAQKDAFHAATDSFLDALHSVDVRMKRQIMALEEAGIVSLGPAPAKNPETGVAKGVSMRPNGMGAVGNLDVGWLNSRGNRVENDMEAEIWGKARALLEKNGDSANKA